MPLTHFIVHHTKIEFLVSIMTLIAFLPMPECMRQRQFLLLAKKES
jgi:ABC-type long-subunit fatty acid transport system fused permease/ATPase subunit